MKRSHGGGISVSNTKHTLSFLTHAANCLSSLATLASLPVVCCCFRSLSICSAQTLALCQNTQSCLVVYNTGEFMMYRQDMALVSIPVYIKPSAKAKGIDTLMCKIYPFQANSKGLNNPQGHNAYVYSTSHISPNNISQTHVQESKHTV